MILFPAIDIKGGKVVRLLQGRFDDVTEYSTDPITVAKKWESLGAQWLHVVDLDGAQTGVMSNFDWITSIAKAAKIPIQVGGGIRSEEAIEKLVTAGVSRVILGTRVVEDENFLGTVLARWPKHIAVSLDYFGGMVVTRGWAVMSQWPVVDLAKKFEQAGLKYLICTNVQQDGTLKGPDFEGLRQISEAVKISVIASGGISSMDDVKKILATKTDNMIGAITGKAIYEGKLDFAAAVKLCSTSV